MTPLKWLGGSTVCTTFVRQRYWREGGPAALRAEQDLEAQALGALWRLLTDDERQFLATAEVFWRDHRLAVGMDFGPVVIELAKAVESLVDRLLVQPFKEWTATNGRQHSKLDTLGDMRAELQRALEVQSGQKHGAGSRALNEYLHVKGIESFAYRELLPALNRINGPRRAAAHPYSVTGATAQDVRNYVLGIGSEIPLIAKILQEILALDPHIIRTTRS